MKEGEAWQVVGNLPRPGYGLRATTVNNLIFLLGRNILRLTWPVSPLSEGGDTQILQFEDSDKTWRNFTQMREQPGIKLEVSTVDCGIVRNYISSEQLPPAVEGTWGAWSDWGPCSVTCGWGVQTRSRTCDGGDDCPGEKEETRKCNTDSCETGRNFFQIGKYLIQSVLWVCMLEQRILQTRFM